MVVALATAGRREILADTLREIARQARLPDRLVIAASSADDVDWAVVASLPFAAAVLHPPGGLPAKRNALLHAAIAADLAIFFDDDFFPATSYLANAEAIFTRHRDVVLATGSLIVDGIHGPGLSPAAARDKLALDPARSPGGALTPRYGAYGCNMVVRLAPVRAHGLAFDEQLPLYAWQEDIDFSRQLAPFGRIVEAEALTGVHLGSKHGRTSGLRFGYSQIANPVYLVRKGTMSTSFGATRMTRNVLANLARCAMPEPYFDRRGRLRGNLLALLDLVRGRLHPRRILDLE